jgi:hypothetical protein
MTVFDIVGSDPVAVQLDTKPAGVLSTMAGVVVAVVKLVGKVATT